MKKRKKGKITRKVIFVIFISVIIFFGIIFYISFSSDRYQDNLIKDVVRNYDILDSDIVLVNKFDNHYIVITDQDVIVLDNRYDEILVENLNKLSVNPNQYKLIYKNNKLMYENTILSDDKVVYEYYDAYSYKLINKIVLGE